MDAYCLSKRSLINFIVWFIVCMIGVFLTWPKYYDQTQDAHNYNSLVEEIFALKYPDILIDKDVIKKFKQPCMPEKKGSRNSFCLDHDSTVLDALYFLKERYHKQVKTSSESLSGVFNLKWINRKKSALYLKYFKANNTLLISGDAQTDNNRERAERFKFILEKLLLNSEILQPKLDTYGEFKVKRKLDVTIHLPLSHREAREDIAKLFVNAKKMPFFEFVNVAVKLTKNSELANLELNDVRNYVTQDLPQQFTSLNIYLTSEASEGYNYVKTNDHKYAIIHSLEKLDAKSALELLSFFTLNLLSITPNLQIKRAASVANIRLEMGEDFFHDEMEIFKEIQRSTHAKIALQHLASTGQLSDSDQAREKIELYKNSPVKQIILMERTENIISKEMYQQLDFPIEFQLALFVAFFTPFIAKFGGALWSYLKYKIS
ncbi:unnamed protein product [Moneuplotes crassus]|uniref:GPI transamidase component PIG-S n=1 Tax=Euplotes crassus TaxID=5936 RepID=A0AAD1UMK1_EUPCR|nr:unnamed protein product [Moneuplotes crassus]